MVFHAKGWNPLHHWMLIWEVVWNVTPLWGIESMYVVTLVNISRYWLIIYFCCCVQDVTLVKSGGSLGFSIIGGTDHSCIPFGNSQPGIFISHVSILILLCNINYNNTFSIKFDAYSLLCNWIKPNHCSPSHPINALRWSVVLCLWILYLFWV